MPIQLGRIGTSHRRGISGRHWVLNLVRTWTRHAETERRGVKRGTAHARLLLLVLLLLLLLVLVLLLLLLVLVLLQSLLLVLLDCRSHRRIVLG